MEEVNVKMLETSHQIAEQFAAPENIAGIEPLGKGNINETYLVSCRDGKLDRFVLQRLNPRVFPEPESVMTNLRLLRDHLARKTGSSPDIIPEIISDRFGNDLLPDREGAVWRALSYIDGSTFEEMSGSIHQQQNLFREAGRLLARFHRLTADLSPAFLRDPLPGLHDTRAYLHRYKKIRSRLGQVTYGNDFFYCEEFISARPGIAGELAGAEEQGILRKRLIHGDPKLDNFIFAGRDGKVIALLDLDTVKPGLILHDLGDFLRSVCNRGGEDPDHLSDVRFDLDFFEAALTGYIKEGRSTLGENDFLHLYQAVRLIPFELGLRFFTDYLEGNVYFKTMDREQNLRRALVQFRLVESIEANEAAIRSVISALV